MKELLKKIDTIIALLLADREERKAERESKLSMENEKRLVEYASKNKSLPPAGNIVNGRDAQDRAVQTDGDLIPFGLSSTQRQILDDFYRR